MEIAFTKLSPTQNVTVLVESPVPREAHAAIAARLLAVDGVGGEQAGFLEPPSLPGARMRLQMMGGEFCGNASMSTAALLAWQDGLPDGAEADLALEVSGASGLTPCHIRRCGDLYRGTVQMPLPERIESVRLSTDHGTAEFPMVVMPGIVHVVAADGLLSRAEIQRRIRDCAPLSPSSTFPPRTPPSGSGAAAAAPRRSEAGWPPAMAHPFARAFASPAGKSPWTRSFQKVV